MILNIYLEVIKLIIGKVNADSQAVLSLPKGYEKGEKSLHQLHLVEFIWAKKI